MLLHETQRFPTAVGGAALTFYDDGRQTGTPHVNGRAILIPVQTCGEFVLLQGGNHFLAVCHVWPFEQEELEELYKQVGNLELLGCDEGDLPSVRVFFGGSIKQQLHGVDMHEPFLVELSWSCWDLYKRDGETAFYASPWLLEKLRTAGLSYSS